MALVKVPFTVTQGGWEYSDALYYEQGSVPSANQIQSDAQARFNTWLALITEPPLLPVELPIATQIASEVTDALGSL
ncbi:MAG: hypothetical protein WCO19_00680 [Candidatus Saccharibacteria bacterium]